MASMYDVPAQELVEKAAEKLKAVPEIKPPSWASYVKTGHSKERPPAREDWWYVRSASVLRAVYRLGPVGVSKLRMKYSSKKNRGVQSEKAFKGSGNILRKILQQLEKAQLVRQTTKEIHKGRIVTPKGKSLLDKTASEIYKTMPHERAAVKSEVKSDVKAEAKHESKQKETKEIKPAEKAERKEKSKDVKEVKEDKK